MEYQNMNESILKSFDNIMFQQTKMDFKAYIFIGFLVIVFNAINGENDFSWSITNICLVILVVLLLLSLMPIASKLLIKIISKFSKIYNIQEQNYSIFYYIDIYNLTNIQFKEVLNKQYDITELTKSDERLIDQILINAKILNFKVCCHSFFQGIIIIYCLIALIALIKYVICPLLTKI